MITIAYIILFAAYYVYALIVEPQASCVEGTFASGPGHVCECNNEGLYICNATEYQNKTIVSNETECEPKMKYEYGNLLCTCTVHGRWRSDNCRDTFYKMLPNKSILRSKAGSGHMYIDFKGLPMVKEGQRCEPGKSYKIACNTCRCGKNNTFICTKMACFYPINIKDEIKKRKQLRQKNNVKNPEKINETQNKFESKVNVQKEEKTGVNKDILRKSSNKNKKKEIEHFLGNKTCVPGKIYLKQCHKCFCTETKNMRCTKQCSSALSYRLEDSETYVLERHSRLHQLSHMGLKCIPGKIYRIQCNTCFCSFRKDLICTLKYCLSTDHYVDQESKKMTGQQCSDSFTRWCIRCECVNKVTKCKPIPNCKAMTGKQLIANSAGKVKMTLDVKKEKCEPNMTYNVHCNQCHCQEDGSLRCTQKVCLKFSQVLALQRHFKLLENNGI